MRTGINIYIIYTPNLGSEISLPGREREQGRFRGSIEGVGRCSGGVLREYGGVLRGYRGVLWGNAGGAADRSLKWISCLGLSCPLYYRFDFATSYGILQAAKEIVKRHNK